MIAAEAVGQRIGRATLLDQVSLSVVPGRLLAVVGPNGAGKSTLLRLLAGEMRPATGRVTLDGVNLSGWESGALARRRAVLSQHVAVDFPMRAYEIVALGRIPHHGRTGRRQDHQIVECALAEADAAGLADRAYATLSGGEQQRVQFARALAQILDARDPAYLLLDEPTASLDIAHQAQLLRAARRLAQAGMGVLAVLHDLNLAAAYADDIAILARGRLAALGAPAAVLDPATIEAVYGWPVIRHLPPGAARPIILPAA